VVHAPVELVEPEPARVLGIDETRFGRPRWRPYGVHAEGRIQWQRICGMFVDILGDQALWG
jgi:hypothetical protein